jgi:hypothetical protein
MFVFMSLEKSAASSNKTLLNKTDRCDVNDQKVVECGLKAFIIHKYNSYKV